MSPTNARWQQRLRAPQIKSFSLLGPTVSWARDRDRGVLLANPNGRFEVYAFDASSPPAQLRQVTARQQGTVGCAIAPDGNDVFWFDDQGGDEIISGVSIKTSDGDYWADLDWDPDSPANTWSQLIRAVQEALNASGADLVVDGEWGRDHNRHGKCSSRSTTSGPHPPPCG